VLESIGTDPFFFLAAKPFYKRLMSSGTVTLIHVINKAFESFWKIHGKFLWQEMLEYGNTGL
jgi:hypothetical protein